MNIHGQISPHLEEQHIIVYIKKLLGLPSMSVSRKASGQDTKRVKGDRCIWATLDDREGSFEIRSQHHLDGRELGMIKSKTNQ